MSCDRTVRAFSRFSRFSRRFGPRRALQPFQQLVPGQLRLRVLIASVSVTLVALAAFDVATVSALRDYLLAQTDTALRNGALAAQPHVTWLPAASDAENTSFVPGAGRLSPPSELQAWVTAHEFPVGQYSVQYVPDVGPCPTVLEDGPAPTSESASPNVPVNLNDLVANGQAQNTTSVEGQQLRSVAIRAARGRLVVSISLAGVDRTVDRMRQIVLIGSAGAVLFIALGVFWLLRRGLRPIETMAAQADRFTAGDLTDRVDVQNLRSEVGRLGSALNGMLARIEASVQEREAGQAQMRRFFADASHELRTPLASLRANAELYQQGALTERARVDEAMRRIALEARRMSGLVDDMLRLARLDQHPDRQREPVELAELVASCVDRMRVAAPEHVWRMEIADEAIVVADVELLCRAVDNLLANVRAHTPPGTAATVALRERDGTVQIEVSDTGPGVPDDGLPRIFDRFYRANAAASHPGSGLGLAIVDQIAAVHGGTVAAEPNTPHGLRVRITLPADTAGAVTQDSHSSPLAV